MNRQFKAMVIDESESGNFHATIQKKSIDDLPDGDLIIKVQYSSLNYKDALSASGNKGVTQKYPHTPGIDSVGIIEESSDPGFSKGTSVIVSGYDLGMNTSGGFSEYIRVPADWAVKLPQNLTARESMIIGTAGLTAGLCVKALAEKHKMKGLKAVVSGATGGVGCMAVKLLSQLGAEVTALTGKTEASKFLEKIGANDVLSRTNFIESICGPMSKGIWDIGIDVAGGTSLSAILASLKYGGSVACCGLVDSPSFKASVFPFILRSNSLIGVDSAEKPIEDKAEIWNLFSADWKLNDLEDICHTVTLETILPQIDKILSGGQTGRVLIKIKNS